MTSPSPSPAQSYAPPPAIDRLIPLKVAAVYLGLTALWMGVSGVVLRKLELSPARLITLEIYKDWIFILLSGVVLMLLVRHYLRQFEVVQTRMSASETRYRRLIETAPEAIVVVDCEHGRFVEHNAQAERIFELAGPELAQRGLVELSPEFQPDGQRSADKASGYIQQALDGGIPVFEWVHRSGTGRVIPSEIRLMRLPAGEARLVRGTITDISGRRNAAEALARSEANYRTLFEQATDAIFLCAADGRLIDVNHRTEQLTGFSREELMKKTTFDVILAEDHDYLRHCQEELLRDGTRFSIYRFHRKDGGTFPGETSTKLLPDGRLLAMVRDMTERRQAEELRRKLETELQQSQKLQAIGTLAGGIAHDFNNILAAILGNAQLLQITLPPAHAAHAELSQILVASHRAKDLVQQILMFSRQREQMPQHLFLEPLLKEAVKLIGVSLPPNVQLDLQVSPGLPAVLADPTQMHQVVVNLCTNALHAMRMSGGTLRLALAAVNLPEETTLSKPNLPPGRYVCLTVADTGHGMDPATLERIYEPFFTTKPVGEGTGLGLAVVHGIVQSSEGAIAASSVPGRGTTIKVYLPARATLAAPESPTPTTLPKGGGEHLVFVDDEVPVAEVAKAMLTMLGYRVTVFSNPRAALEFFREQGADVRLLLADLSMPGMSGVDLIRESMKLRPKLSALLLTGYGKAFDSKASVGLNIREVIHKPFTMGKLATSIVAALESQK